MTKEIKLTGAALALLMSLSVSGYAIAEETTTAPVDESAVEEEGTQPKGAMRETFRNNQSARIEARQARKATRRAKMMENQANRKAHHEEMKNLRMQNLQNLQQDQEVQPMYLEPAQ